MPREKVTDRIVAAVVRGWPGGARASTSGADVAQPVQPREEQQVLGGRELGIDEQVVGEEADPAAQRRAAVARGVGRRSGRCRTTG